MNSEKTASEGDLVIFERDGDGITAMAKTDAKLLAAGEPIAESIVGRGPFVMNTGAEIQQAFEDYQSGRMGAARATARETPRGIKAALRGPHVDTILEFNLCPALEEKLSTQIAHLLWNGDSGKNSGAGQSGPRRARTVGEARPI